MITHLFVYGTLRPGQQRWQHLAPFVVDEGHDDSVIGVLYNTGNGYPAARFTGDGSIHGRVYVLNRDRLDECLRLLDEVEGAVLDLFGRVAVTTSRGLEAWAYEYHGNEELPEITSGNWLLEAR
ncbi:MAG: gamma-glutamylcyclotransferase family protein [Ilumatobacteraceae bacterium]